LRERKEGDEGDEGGWRLRGKGNHNKSQKMIKMIKMIQNNSKQHTLVHFGTLFNPFWISSSLNLCAGAGTDIKRKD
jgi:hypothetical protein